jgi:hypothetical protein
MRDQKKVKSNSDECFFFVNSSKYKKMCQCTQQVSSNMYHALHEKNQTHVSLRSLYEEISVFSSFSFIKNLFELSIPLKAIGLRVKI